MITEMNSELPLLLESDLRITISGIKMCSLSEENVTYLTVPVGL